MKTKLLISKNSFLFKYKVGGVLKGDGDLNTDDVLTVGEDGEEENNLSTGTNSSTESVATTPISTWKSDLKSGENFYHTINGNQVTYTYGGTDKHGNHIVSLNGTKYYVSPDDWSWFGNSGSANYLQLMGGMKSGLKPGGRKYRKNMFNDLMGFFNNRDLNNEEYSQYLKANRLSEEDYTLDDYLDGVAGLFLQYGLDIYDLQNFMQNFRNSLTLNQWYKLLLAMAGHRQWINQNRYKAYNYSPLVRRKSNTK